MSLTRRKVPMKVLCLSLGRTGTASMQVALEQLGYYHTWHGFSVWDHPDRCKIWEGAVDAKVRGDSKALDREFFDTILGDCQAVTDLPCNAFSEELIAAYPEAKVILVERDIEDWYRSFSTGVIGSLFSTTTYIVATYAQPILGLNSARLTRKTVLMQCEASDSHEAVKNLRTVYRKHYARIREIVPSDRLLNYDLSSGWKPLCEFLGHEEPSTPFPRVNEAAALQKRVAQVQKKMITAAFRKLISVVGPCILTAMLSIYLYQYK